MRRLLEACLAATILIVPAGASAAVLYSSGSDAQITAPDISLPGFVGSGEFTLDSDSILTAIVFDEWVNHTIVPGTVDWSISTAPDSGILFQGAAAPLTNTFLYNVRPDPFDVYESSFDVPNLALSAGTYWLNLSGCAPSAADCGWGVVSASGPDVQFQNSPNAGAAGKYAFAIEGEAPEPSTWLMLGSALAGLGLRIRRRA